MKKVNSLLKLSLVLLLQTLCSPLFAQSPKAIITGVIRDSATQKPLQYATAELFKQGAPAQILKSVYTNDKGQFTIAGVDTGSYVIIVSHSGFGEKRESITVSDKSVDISPIYLSPASATLQGVVVKSRKPLIEQADDKIVFNVENDPVAKTETAVDILRRTPFVSVDGEGNVQVNGQTNFRVLLNGRETAMFAQNVKEALKGFPGSLIVKIEVITTPSAKYDAEGVGGIINIITKKKVVGYNGSINTYYTNTGWYNVNTNFSAKFGKVGVTLYYGAGGGYRVPGVTRGRYMPTNPTLAGYKSRTLIGNRLMTNFWNFGNGEVSYEVDSLNTLSFYGNISGGNNHNRFSQTITMAHENAPDSVSFLNQNNRNEYPTKSAGADYIRKYSSNKEKEFSLRFNGEWGTSNSFLNSVQDNQVIPDRYVINNSEAVNKQYTIQSDYVLPLTNSRKFESGVKAILRRATSDFQSMERKSETEDYKTNSTNTDYFSYDQDVYSVYSTYAFKVKKTTFRLGARYEHTDLTGNFNSGKNKKLSQTYDNILPNLQLNTKWGKTTMVFTYGQRLQRPAIWNLNPFQNNNDALNVSYGNPDLQPQLVHTVSTQARVNKGATFMGLTLNTSYSDNMIVQYARLEGNKVITTSGNVGEELGIGINGNINTKLTPDWTLSLNGHARWARVSNRTAPGESRSGVGGNANMNSTYTINKRFNLSSYAGFFQAPVTFQSRYPLNLWYGINAGYKFFKEKLTASVGISNFFEKDRDYRTVTQTPQFEYTMVSTMPNRGLSISLNWNFGKMTENVSKKKGVNNDDLLSGGSGN